jgi:hypothetical protein
MPMNVSWLVTTLAIGTYIVRNGGKTIMPGYYIAA